jgi:hypothetical protein
MHGAYTEVISLVERLHRHFLEVVKLELDGFGIHDINNVQGLLLFNIGDAEMTVGELILRGCYLGSNVSYNLKKMVENGYLSHERSVHDGAPTLVGVVYRRVRGPLVSLFRFEGDKHISERAAAAPTRATTRSPHRFPSGWPMP